MKTLGGHHTFIMKMWFPWLACVGFIALLPMELLASEQRDLIIHSATTDPRAIFCLIIFLLSYLLVMTEEQTRCENQNRSCSGQASSGQ